MKRIIRQATYVASGTLILASILYQIYSLAASNNLELTNFFSLFTIQSNILAGIVFILASYKQNPTIDSLRGIATLSLLITSLGFIVLLGGTQDYLLPWINVVVHYLAPAFALLSWICDPPTTKISFKQALAWLLYPLLYFTYSMARGYITNWYPYDFIDPNKVSIAVIAYNFGVVFLGSLIIIWLMTRITTKPGSSLIS